MNTITEESPAVTATRRRIRAPRIDRGTIVLTVLSVALALLVLLQMLPGSGGTDAEPAVRADMVLTLPSFIVGAVVSMIFIAAVLMRASRRLED